MEDDELVERVARGFATVQERAMFFASTLNAPKRTAIVLRHRHLEIADAAERLIEGWPSDEWQAGPNKPALTMNTDCDG
jgi:hypothetical protein